MHVLVDAAEGELPAAPKLVNERPLFVGEVPAYKRPTQYAAWSMRLSPDGTRVLYTRPAAGVQSDAPDAKYDRSRRSRST